MRASPILFLLLIVVLNGCGTSPNGPPPRQARQSIKLRPSSEFKSTVVVAHTESRLAPSKNVVYCATFQLAWNTLQKDVIEQSIQLEGNPPAAKVLNKMTFRGKELSPESLLAMAGWTKDGVVDQLKSQLTKRFPNSSFPIVPSSRGNVAIAYAYLEKRLSFAENFDRLKKPLEFNSVSDRVKVHSFGIVPGDVSERRRRQTNQTVIASYKDDDDFVVCLYTSSDQITLAKVPPRGTLAETIKAVEQRIDQWAKDPGRNAKLGISESLSIPVISLGMIHRYSQLEKPLLNQRWRGLNIAVAAQAIRFHLDEKGAQLSSSASLQLKSSIRPKPRHLKFDRPFLLMLKEKSDVYFAMWVATPEVMMRIGK